jgi:hypothetical protein
LKKHSNNFPLLKFNAIANTAAATAEFGI